MMEVKTIRQIAKELAAEIMAEMPAIRLALMPEKLAIESIARTQAARMRLELAMILPPLPNKVMAIAGKQYGVFFFDDMVEAVSTLPTDMPQGVALNTQQPDQKAVYFNGALRALGEEAIEAAVYHEAGHVEKGIKYPIGPVVAKMQEIAGEERKTALSHLMIGFPLDDELAADRYAVEHGHKKGLLKLLQKLIDTTRDIPIIREDIAQRFEAAKAL